jgi:hypothetical protein
VLRLICEGDASPEVDARDLLHDRFDVTGIVVLSRTITISRCRPVTNRRPAST